MAYVFFDIDETIYSYTVGIPEPTREAIRLLRANGHHPVICTGRTQVMIFQEILDMGFDGIIAGAGSLVSWRGKELSRRIMPREVSEELIRTLKGEGFSIFAEGHDDFYYDPEMIDDCLYPIFDIYHVHIPEHFKPLDFTSDMKISKVSAAYTRYSNRDSAVEKIKDEFNWVDHYGALFETIPKHISKGTGIRFLMDYLGEGLEETYAFGDSFNDLEMLQTVKHGVVMGNAKESFKKLIPLKTEGMNEGGIYNALKRFGLI